MFQWLFGKPTCPVSPESEQWLESQFEFLLDQFGTETIFNARTVTPTKDFFPTKYQPTESGINELVERVAELMQFDSTRLVLSFYEDDKPVIGVDNPGVVTSEGQVEIFLEINSLQEPDYVIAGLSREIGHAHLTTKIPDAHQQEDHDELSELMAVFLGCGIFLANTAVASNDWVEGSFTGWSVTRHSYLSMNEFGYAMALYAFERGELKPEWANHLRLDVKAALLRGLRYLEANVK